jgi:hypothetical protein
VISELWIGKDLEGSGRGLNLRYAYYPDIRPKELKIATKTLSQDICSSSQDLNPTPPEYVTEVFNHLTTTFGDPMLSSVVRHNMHGIKPRSRIVVNLLIHSFILGIHIWKWNVWDKPSTVCCLRVVVGIPEILTSWRRVLAETDFMTAAKYSPTANLKLALYFGLITVINEI